jgi:DNA primase
MLSSGRRNTLTEAAARYAENLTEQGRSYLASRGIDGTAVEVCQLGSVIEPEPEHVPYEGMLSIPYITPSGVVGFKFRQTDPYREPKYLIPTGQSTLMFNTRAVYENTDTICVCEGELDTIIAHYVCGLPAVGIPGVRNWKQHHPRVLDGFRNVFVLADNDVKDDGSNPGAELGKAVMADLPQARMVWLPPGQDVNDVYLAGGVEAVRNLLPDTQVFDG